MSTQNKTTIQHWDSTWARKPSVRLPSAFNVGVRNRQRLLRRHVHAGMRFLEVGCAPGKMLAWVSSVLGAEVSGIDYSPRGAEVTAWLLGQLGVKADIRCEDVHNTTFQEGTFDVVFSAGLIEHFEDPRDIVSAHVSLVRPGGVALIAVPNYGSIYGVLQRRFDPDNLALHNLRIMSPAAMRALAPTSPSLEVSAYPFGHASLGLVSLHRRWGRIGSAVHSTANALSLLAPVDTRTLAPLLVLEIHKGPASVAGVT